jgi:alpha-1,3-rhamnosyl/mannosyltransferase
MPMRVVMNGLAALKTRTGVGHYVANLHRHLTRLFPDSGFSLYPDGGLAPLVERAHQLFNDGGGPATGNRPARWTRLLRLGLQTAKHAGKIAAGVHFAHHCRGLGFDLYHEPNFIPFATDLPTVVTVHDLSVLLHPEWHPADRVKHHERHFAPAVRRATHVIVVSEQVRAEALRETGLRPERVTTIHNGVAPEFRPLPGAVVAGCRARLGLPQRYFLCVGTIEPRKNILTVLRAFADLPGGIRAACPLILAGPWGWKSEAERDFFLTIAQPAGAVYLGYVPAADLPAVYNGATALLYPSLYEGFGLPPVEMLACGGVVICSREAAAVREVVGRHGLYMDAGDVAGWRDALRRLADGAVAPCGGVEHAARFTWDRAARETFAVYETVLGRRSVSQAREPLSRAA